MVGSILRVLLGVCLVENLQTAICDPTTKIPTKSHVKVFSDEVKSRIVKRQVSVPQVKNFSFPAEAQLGQRIEALCSVKFNVPGLTFAWLKDGSPISESSDGVVLIEARSFLAISIDSLKPSHTGNYTCVARSPSGQDSHTATLVAFTAPFWHVLPQDTFVRTGSSVELKCEATGYPVPNVTWTSSGE